MTSKDERKEYAIENLGNGVTTIVAEMARMRHEIARLKGELERVQTESADAFKAQEENDRLRDELVQQSITLSAEHQHAERILAALREPSESVLLAAVEAVPYGASYAALTRCIPAAVAAAAQEVANDEG